ncbi:MAG: dihydroorotate dehydrogenase electron transfer subunit [Thermomicrobiales bacterium]
MARTTSTTESQGRTRPKEFFGEIRDVRSVMGDSSLIAFSAPPELVVSAQPGQFIEILCREPGAYDPLIRRPYSVFRADRERSELTILVRPFGRGSQWLCSRPVGTAIDVLGLLGNTFMVAPRSTHLLMVAGGVGAAPVFMLAEHAIRQKQSVTFLLGAMNGDGLIAASEMPQEVEYIVATNDGSQGHLGFVTDLVPNYMQWADQIFACGPEPMFQSLRSQVLKHRFGKKPEVQVSVERTMACGVGACLGCVVETKSGMVPSCTDGPVFDMDRLVWG